jgi:hypothetical protein
MFNELMIQDTRRGLKILGSSLALLLTACGAPKSRPAGSPHPVAPIISQAGSCHVDRAQSELRNLVYRAGPMGRLGHNHVIVNRGVDGVVAYAGDPSAASFSLSIPSAPFRSTTPTCAAKGAPILR